MTSPVKATQDAQKLLQKYSAEKTRLSQATKKSNGVNVEDDMDTAIAEGSILGQTYSEKKRRLGDFPSPQPPGGLTLDSGHSGEAVEAIRRALSELDAMENADDIADEIKYRIPAISKLLKGVEGHLASEVASVTSPKCPQKILFSPGVGSVSTINEDRIDIAGSPSDTPRAKDVLKVYMKNQLDLQESEWESYEDTFNAIAEKLEDVEEQLVAVTEEKDALLTEKLTWEELKVDYDALSLSFADMEKKCAELAASSKDLQQSQETLNLHHSTSTSTLTTRQSGDEDKVAQLEVEIESIRSQLRDSEHEYDLLSETLEEKNAHISSLEASLTAAAVRNDFKSKDGSELLHTSMSEADSNDKDVLKVYMRNQLELQENEWEQYEETITSLAEQLEAAQDQSGTVQMEKEAVQAELDRILVVLTSKEAEMETLATDVSRFQNQVAESNYEISELKVVLSEKDSVTSSQASLIASLQEKHCLEELSRAATEKSHKHEIDTLQKQIIELTQDLDMLELSKRSVTDIVAERDADIDSLESELRRLEAVEKELLGVQEKLLRAEKFNDTLQSEMMKKDSIIEELQATQQSEGRVMQEMVERVKYIDDMKESQLQARHAQELADLEQRITDTECEVTKLVSEKKQMEEELAAQADIYADELQDVRISLRAAQTQISVHVSEIRRLQDANAKLQLAVDCDKEEKTENMVVTSNELMFLSGRISTLEAENTELRGQLIQISQSHPRAGSAPPSPSNRDRLLTRQATLEQENQDLLDKVSYLETQNYHLQESSGHKDSTIKRMRQMFVDQMTMGGMSPPDSPTHGPSGETPDDLERALEVMEKKMQVQIRNLQYLQDSLSDEKQRVKALLSTKSVLQEKIATLEASIRNQDVALQQAKLAVIECSGRETNLKNEIEKLNGKIAGLHHQVEDARMQSNTSQSLIESLQIQNAEGRKLLEEKSSTLDTMTTSIAATVTSPGSVYRAESRADKASARVKALEQEMLELRSLNGALEANLSHKTHRAEELSREVGRLRGTITAKVDELNELRARDLRVEAELSAQLMEKERTTESLREMIQRMEDNKKEADSLLEERLRKLLDEHETNKQLRQLLMMVNEKDSTTEEFIYQLQLQEGSITTRLEETVAQLHKKTNRCEELEEQLRSTSNRLTSLQSELLNVQSSDSASFVAADDSTMTLRAQLDEADHMLADKNDEADELKGFVREMEDEILSLKDTIAADARAHRLTEEDKLSMQRALSDIADETKYISERQLEHMRSLEASMDRLAQKYTQKLLSCGLKLDALTRLSTQRVVEMRDVKRDLADVMGEKQKWEQKVNSLEDTLEKSREAVRTAEMALERKEFEKNELIHRLQSAASHDLSFRGDAMESGAMTVGSDDKASLLDYAASRPDISVIEEFSKISERLEVAENRTMEMSAHSARTFAKTAKGMALLEGENARLKCLVNHLRLVNAKLMGDIKVAGAAGLQSNALTLRFHMLEKELQSYMQRCAALEAEIEEKGNALIESVEESHLLEEQRIRTFEEELKEEQERIVKLMDESAAKDRTIGRLQDLNESLQRQVEKGLETALLESESRRADIQAALVRAQSAETLSSTLRLKVTGLESEKVNLENSLEEMMKSRDDKIADWAQKKAHLNGTIESMKAIISELERAVEDGKTSICSLQEEVAIKESSIQELTAKLHDAEGDYNDSVSRLRELELSLENASVERGRLEVKCADLNAYLNEARKQLEAQDNELRAVNAKSGKAEEKTRKILSEKHALEVLIDEMRMQNEGMADTANIAESKVDELQFDLTQAKNEIELLESEIQGKKGELIHVKSQLESTSRDKSSLEMEVGAQQQKLTALTVTADRLAEVENILQARDVDLRQVNGAEHMLIMDMKAVMNRLEIVMSVSRKAKSSTVEIDGRVVPTHAAQQGAPHSEMFDLLATPLKNLLTPSKELSAAINRERVSAVAVQPSEGGHAIDTQLTELRDNFEKLVVMTDEHLLRSAQLEESHRSLHLEIAESKRYYESSDQKYRALLAEKETISARLEVSENEVRVLNDEIDGLIEERDNALHAGEDHAQWIRMIRRDMEEIIESDEVIRVLSLTATEVEREGDHTTVESFNGALIQSVTTCSHPLRDAITQARATVNKMCRHLRSVHSSLQAKQHTLKKLEVQVVNMQQNWDTDIDKLLAKNNDLTAALDRERALLIQTKADLHAHENVNAELKTLVSEYSLQNLELEDDVKASNVAMSDLRAALKEAEALCVELRGRIRTLSSEKDDLQHDLSTANRDLSTANTKIANLDMQVEQWSSDCKRVKVERDNLLDLRNSLRSEAEAARAEAAVAMEKVRTHKSDDDVRASFELERLLAALGATLDNVIGVSVSSNSILRIANGTMGMLDTSIHSQGDKGTRHSLNSSYSSEKSIADACYSTIASRVEYSVKRLSELRGLSRDERRNTRHLEEKIQALQHELESLRLSADQEKEELRLMLTEHSEKEKEVAHQLLYMESLSGQNVRLEDEVNRLKHERDVFMSGVDTEKKSLTGALSSIRLRDGEIDNLKELLEEKTTEWLAKEESLRSMQSDLTELRNRLVEKDDALRTAKATGVRQQGTIDRLEVSVERVKKEKTELERKLKSAYDNGGAAGSHVVQAGSRIRELEREMSEAHRIHRDRELEMEEKILSLTTDNVDLTGRIESMEERLRHVSADGSSQRKENTLTTQELYRLQSRLDKEIADHKKTQTALQNMRNLEEDWRLQAEGTTALMEEEEQRSMKAEAKAKELEEQVSELKVSLSERDTAIQLEREKRLHAEQDIHRQKILLDRTQRELTLTSTKASALRAEGRKARQEVQGAVECLRDVAGILQATDANGGDNTLQLAYDIDMDTDMSRSISMIMPHHRDDDAETAQGGDSLGVLEIVSVVNSIRSFSAIIKRLPQNQAALECTLRRLEIENTRLQRELDGIEIVNEDRIQRLHSEIVHLEEQLRSYRRNTDLEKDAARTIMHLEHEVTLLRERCNKCDRKEKQMLLEIANLTAALERQNDRNSSAADNSRFENTPIDSDKLALSATEEELLHKVQTLQQELDAVRHHRTVLQNSVSEMESMVFKEEHDFSDRTSWIAPVTVSKKDTSTDQDFEQLSRKLQRYQRRIQAVEELNGIYRKGLLALYSDGSFYGALQFEAKKLCRDPNAAHGWIEREVALITKGYLDEIELLEKECDDLVAQVKEGESYRAELRVRLEDTLRALYRGGKGQFAEALSHQLEHMSLDLKKSQHQVVALSQQLADSQQSHRLRHDKLIAEFTRSMQIREDISSQSKQSENELAKISDVNAKTIQSLNREISECKSLVTRLRGEVDEKDRLNKEKDRAIVQLRRELIDVDSQLDSERRRHASALRTAEETRILKEEDDGDTTTTAAAATRSDTPVLRRNVVIPSVDPEKAPQLPPPSPPVPKGEVNKKANDKRERDTEKISLSESLANRSPPPRSRASSTLRESSSTPRGTPVTRTHSSSSGAPAPGSATTKSTSGTSPHRRHLSPYAHPIGGAATLRQSKTRSPSRASASYAATTTSSRNGRQVAETSSSAVREADAPPRMRSVRATSTITAMASSRGGVGNYSHTSQHEQSTTELFERQITGSAIGGSNGSGSVKVPEWHGVEGQGVWQDP